MKMDLQEVGFGGIDWFERAEDRDRWKVLVNAVRTIGVPLNAGNILTNLEPFSF